ncbi:MAG TPA: hypothetical protein VI790_00610 [Candidatus Nanoarchaeia archaeon]|nr:hypothetical protein [Candidatus Nanoarchaeia archaeon]
MANAFIEKVKDFENKKEVSLDDFVAFAKLSKKTLNDELARLTRSIEDYEITVDAYAKVINESYESGINPAENIFTNLNSLQLSAELDKMSLITKGFSNYIKIIEDLQSKIK